MRTRTSAETTGKPAHILSSEEWTLGPDGPIAEPRERYDQAEYNRQLRVGVAAG